MTYTPTPESELTEQEVRQGFNRLRELYQDATHRIHELKVERGKMNVEICELKHQISHLKKENERLKNKKEKQEKTDFKKKFFDSL